MTGNRAEQRAEIDELLRAAAVEHAQVSGHLTVLVPGEGWGCRTCDPDLFRRGASFESFARIRSWEGSRGA